MMGLMLMAYGTVNLLVIGSINNDQVRSRLSIVNALFCGIGFGIALKYFFILPVVFMGISFVAYGFASIKSRQGSANNG